MNALLVRELNGEPCASVDWRRRSSQQPWLLTLHKTFNNKFISLSGSAHVSASIHHPLTGSGISQLNSYLYYRFFFLSSFIFVFSSFISHYPSVSLSIHCLTPLRHLTVLSAIQTVSVILPRKRDSDG